jgi:membrane protease YdiL (CAAX protease family)
MTRAGRRDLPAGSLLAFFSITYAVTWTCFFAARALSDSSGPLVARLSGFRTPLLLLGTFAPSLVALGLTARDRGLQGVEGLLGRLFASRVATRWYLFAIGYMAAIKLAFAVIHRFVTGAWPPFGVEPWYVIAAAIVISTPVQGGEEIGWRGYALPRLAARVGLARASLVLGVFWACWHLPLFFIPGLNQYGQSFPLFMLANIALSVAMAWLYANTNGSLLLVMLMHSAVNQTVGIVPTRLAKPGNPFALDTSPAVWLTAALLWIMTAYFLVRMRRVEWTGAEPGRDR